MATTTALSGVIGYGRDWKNADNGFVGYNRITVPASVATTDVIEAIAVPAGVLVFGVVVKMVTAATGSALTADIGVTGGTVDGFDSNVDLKGAANTVTQSTPTDTYTAAGGLLFTAADTIDIKADTVTSVTGAAVLDIWAYGIKLY